MFIVSCQQIGRRNAFSLKFPFNEGLIEKIKNLPKENRTWNPNDKVWELTTIGLLTLIRLYKGSDKIRFDFGDEKYRTKALEMMKKSDATEKDKAFQLKELEKKKIHWLEYKQHLEENYEQYREIVHKNLKEGIKLYPHQIIGTMFLDEVNSALLALDMGTGKAQPLDSKLLTPNGYINMGDIKIGDRVVGNDGKFKNVINIFPQGKKKIYEIRFNDGTTTQCCEEHIWSVNTTTRMYRARFGENYPYMLKTLKELIDNGLYFKNGNRKFYIPIVKPIEFEEKNLFIHPYILGCLLGDGGISQHYVMFSTVDKEIIDEINNRLPENHILHKANDKYDYRLISDNHKNDIIRELRNLELMGHKSLTKFIPNLYKYGSIEQRLELLQGILDTDSYPMPGGGVELTLGSKQLIDDVQFVVESLGGIARYSEKYVKYDDELRLYHKLNIKIPPQFIPFKLERRKKQYIIPTKYLPNRGIDNITYIGEKEAQCILIDSEDHLYCTDHCILTHNTLISISYSELKKFEKVFVITPNSLKFNYLEEVFKFTEQSKAHIIGWNKNKYSIEESKYIIVNYDYFNGSDKEKRENKRKGFSKRVLDKFNKLNIGKIDCLICDESHRISNNKSQTFINFKKIFNDDIFKDKKVCKIFMSGSPAKSKISNLYTVLHEISPLEFATKEHFNEYYCGMKWVVDEGWVYSEEDTKYEELFHAISPYMYRKKKKDVLKDLPDVIIQKVTLEMTPSEYKVYEELERGIANEFINEDIFNPGTRLLRLKQYTSHLKTKYICDLIDSIIETGDKFVIVDFFKETLKELYDKYKEISVLHTGEIKETDVRAQMIRDFQNNENVKLFIGSQQTVNEGLTLTAASKIALLTIPWDDDEISQLFSRLQRIGQKNTVNCYLFVYNNSIDEYILSITEQKKKNNLLVLDGEKYVSNIGDLVMNDVIEIIKNKYK